MSAEATIFETAASALKGVLDLIRVIRNASPRGSADNKKLQEFKDARKVIGASRRRLCQLAAQLKSNELDGGPSLHGIPLLCQNHWLVDTPVQLAIPDENLEDDSRQLVTTFVDKSAKISSDILADKAFKRRVRELLPYCSDTDIPYSSYSEAIQEISKPDPDLFQSRPSYALTFVGKGASKLLRFKKSRYFDYIDVGELLAYEFAMELARIDDSGDINFSTSDIQKLLEPKLALRKLAGLWHDISKRPSITGVCALTIIEDKSTGSYTFPLLDRENSLGTTMGTVSVVPAGEFQPTSESLGAWERHCTIWQTLLREYAEELLGMPEARSFGCDMRQLTQLPEIRALLDLIRCGKWKSYFLGVGLDCLTLKPNIFTVSIVDRDGLRAILPGGKLPTKIGEGTLLLGVDGWGENLTVNELIRYRDDERTSPAGAGCIELFLRHKDKLLPDLFGSARRKTM